MSSRNLFILLWSLSWSWVSSLCGDYDSASSLPGDVVSIATKLDHKESRETYLLPKVMHWHIYATIDNDPPRYSVAPTDAFRPSLSSEGNLRFEVDDSLRNQGYTAGQQIEAAINIYIPISKLNRLDLDGQNDVVEITYITTDNSTDITERQTSLDVYHSGIGSSLFIDTPDVQVDLYGSSIDGLVLMNVAPDSTVSMSGINEQVKVKSENLEGVDVKGVNSLLVIEGEYDELSLAGVDSMVLINGETGCSRVQFLGGISTSCRVAPTETVDIAELPCFSSTIVIEACENGEVCWVLSRAAKAGVVVATLALCGACIGLACFVCGCRQNRRNDNDHFHNQTLTAI